MTGGPGIVPVHTSTAAEPTEIRSDVQGLRAVAVSLVLGFHLWPDRIPGGYVGVDVFLVISGFLITSHLLRDSARGLRGVLDFWARRLRRLLPASLLVIAATVIAGCVILPVTQLASLWRDAVAATVYVVNWVLAANSVDYLGADDPASPLQHYWSLSVEEQFYLVWPILVAVTLWLAPRWTSRWRLTLTIVLSSFTALSLAASVVWTSISPASAYFVTPTRLWELGLGGVLACVIGSGDSQARWMRSSALRSALAWGGLALIAWSAFAFTPATAFPGVSALVPTLGASLFIAASSNSGRISPSRISSTRAVRHVGDISYSLYLWHWPLIVLLPFIVSSALTSVHKILILAASLVLATLTKVVVEDPVRRSRWLGVSLRRTFLLAAAATAMTLAIASLPAVYLGATAARMAEEQQRNAVLNANCFGAEALSTPSCPLRGVGVVPAPADALNDKSDAYPDNCFALPPFPDTTCTYGSTADDAIKIALVGNSHAAQWLPALQKFAATHNASVTTFIGLRCRPTTNLIVFETAAQEEQCSEWGERVMDATDDAQFDLVVFTSASTVEEGGLTGADAVDAMTDGYLEPLSTWANDGQKVLVIRDTPIPGFDMPTCVASNTDQPAQCDGLRGDWVLPDPIVEASAAVDDPHIRVADLTDLFCSATTCFSVVGGVLVYFDDLHITGTYITTVAPFLATQIEAALASDPDG